MNEKYLEGSEELVQNLTEWRVKELRAKVSIAPPSGYDGTCPECECPVPTQRIALGFYNCVDCQSDLERRGKHGTGGQSE